MANVGKTPGQDQVFYHLKMAFTLAVIKAKAFCRKVSIALLPAGIRASLEKSGQGQLSILNRSVASTPSNSGAFLHADVEHVKADFKKCVRSFMDHLADGYPSHSNHDGMIRDAIDLRIMVHDRIDCCDSLDELVQLLDQEAPGATRKGLFTALDEIISETGFDSTLSEGGKRIITEAMEKDEPLTGQISGPDSDIPWVVRTDKEKAMEALKSSFLVYLVHMISDAENRSRSMAMSEDDNEPREEEVQVRPEMHPAGMKMKQEQRRDSQDSGVSSVAGSLSRTASIWEEDVGDLKDDVFESSVAEGAAGTELDWDESFVDDWKLRELKTEVEACDNYDDLLELVKEKAPKHHRYALLSGLRDDYEKYGPYLN